MQFKEFALCAEVLDGIRDMGFETATEIQEKAIPLALEQKNILATSFTGSGKTAAFVLPVIHKLFTNKGKGIRALVLAPTRELAQQIDEQFWGLGYHAGISSACVYGGSNWSEQEKALKAGVDIVVATPGRLLDQMKITSYDFSNIEVLILDEADRMLDMGFLPDVRSIINRIPKERQTLLFSATSNTRIETIANEFANGTFERVKVGRIAPAKGIEQSFYKVADEQKRDLLLSLYEDQKWHSAIVFVATKRGVDMLSRAMDKKGVAVDSIHGDRDQKEREKTLEKFRSGKVKVLIATDVMSRGIDVDDISHVINFDVPNDVDDYIHRIGRTARAASTGTAITFVSRRDWRSMLTILDSKGLEVKEMPLPEALMEKGNKDKDNRGRQDRGRRSTATKDSVDPKAAAGAPPVKVKKEPEPAPEQEKDDTSTSNNAEAPKRRKSPRRARSNNKRVSKPKESPSDNEGSAAVAAANEAKTSDVSAKQPRSRNAKRRPNRKRRPASANSNDEDNAQNKIEVKDSGKKDDEKKSRRRAPRPKRKKQAASGDNQKTNDDSLNNAPSRRRSADSNAAKSAQGARRNSSRRGKDDDSSGSKRTDQRDRKKDNVKPELKKHIKEQEKLIAQVQQSSIKTIDSAGRNSDDSGNKAGIWGKIKKLFG
ncbi:MAG: DEAD/DEAH box helicase [Balneolales bacterium]|nr:DEAD/DEAH box helicase [Balneolales bacterium]